MADARAREADDLARAEGAGRAWPRCARGRRRGPRVRLLWDVCRIPDFRGISPAEHAGMLERIFGFLHEWGRVPDDWMARQVTRIDRTDGDIDTLSQAAGLYPHMDLRGPAEGLGGRRKSLAGGDPRGRRPAVGRAPRGADAAIRRPADKRAAAPAEAEGEPRGRGERQGRGDGRGRSSSAGWKGSASARTRAPRRTRRKTLRQAQPRRRCGPSSTCGRTGSTTRPTPRSTTPSRAA